MTTPAPTPATRIEFDADAGVLRLGHGTLSVLALLAADPVDPRLHDHAVAPHVAALRAAGLLGRGGVHEAARPLVDAMGAARATIDLAVADRHEARRCTGWVGPDLVVVAVPSPEDRQVYDLVADAPAALPSLVDDLVGLAAGSAAPPDAPTLRVVPDAFDALVARGAQTTPVEVAAALATDRTDDADGTDGERATEAVAAVAAGLATRWALTVTPHDGAARGVAVLDAGASGVWFETPDGDVLVLSPTSAAQVRARVAGLVAV